MNKYEHIHRIQSQWVALFPLIWNSGRFQLSKEALESFESSKMPARGELRFCEWMGGGKYALFAGEIKSHLRDRESTGEVGKESKSTVQQGDDVHQSVYN
jgi:hypothetical protein